MNSIASNFKGLVLAVFLIIPTNSLFAAVLQIPQTGQTACYDLTGTPIVCTGTGQDGAYRTGQELPRPRFADNGNETMTDNLTGLIWTKNAGSPGPDICVPGASRYWQAAFD